MKLYAPSHQRAALPLHKQIVLIFGLLALVSILGGIVAVVIDARSETDLRILGAHLTTGHVGVALITAGLIMTFFTVRTVLRSHGDLAALPGESSESAEFGPFPAAELGYRLYDSLDYFVERIGETTRDKAGSFRDNHNMFTVSFNHDGQVTRQLAAKFGGLSLWLHFEVRGMILMRRSNDGFPKGGVTIYEHVDHAGIEWSKESTFESKGDQAEFLRLGPILLGAIYRCAEARPPAEEWMEKLEV